MIYATELSIDVNSGLMQIKRIDSKGMFYKTVFRTADVTGYSIGEIAEHDFIDEEDEEAALEVLASHKISEIEIYIGRHTFDCMFDREQVNQSDLEEALIRLLAGQEKP